MGKPKLYTNKKEFDKANQAYSDSLAVYNGETEWNKFLDKNKNNPNKYQEYQKFTYNGMYGNNRNSPYIKGLEAAQRLPNFKLKMGNTDILGLGKSNAFSPYTYPTKPTQQPIFQQPIKPVVNKPVVNNKVEPDSSSTKSLPIINPSVIQRNKIYKNKNEYQKALIAYNDSTLGYNQTINNAKIYKDDLKNISSNNNNKAFYNKDFDIESKRIQNCEHCKEGMSFYDTKFNYGTDKKGGTSYKFRNIKPIGMSLNTDEDIFQQPTEIPKYQPYGDNQNYTAGKYLKLKGKPSGYINMGDKKGIQEYKFGGTINDYSSNYLNFIRNKK